MSTIKITMTMPERTCIHCGHRWTAESTTCPECGSVGEPRPGRPLGSTDAESTPLVVLCLDTGPGSLRLGV